MLHALTIVEQNLPENIFIHRQLLGANHVPKPTTNRADCLEHQRLLIAVAHTAAPLTTTAPIPAMAQPSQ